MPTLLNALTIDFEDWAQSTIGTGMPITRRMVHSTRRLLDLLDGSSVRATFFVLGRAAERFADLVREVQQRGHEIASHGYGHELVFDITPERFREDIRRSADQLEQITGRRPLGYRAPAFSITGKSLWAAPILAEEGFRYDSSVFPIAGPRYGIPDAPRFPYRWPDCDLMEFPLSTARFAGRNWPICGGGYLRLLPVALVQNAIRGINAHGRPAVVYIHPYELDPRELPILKAAGWPIDPRTYFMQTLFRDRVGPRLRRLLRRFHFAPAADVLGVASP